MTKNVGPARGKLRILRTAELSPDRHAVFCFMDRSIGVLDGADTPAALVMLGHPQLGTRRPQMLESCLHMRLIGPRGIQTHGCNCCDNNDTNFQCFHGLRLISCSSEVKADRGLRIDGGARIS
jgi:hypothetical protein